MIATKPTEISSVSVPAIATVYKGPTPSSKGVDGCGESVAFEKRLYFYRTALAIPRHGRVTFVKYEGGWNHGTKPQDVEFLALAWDGSQFIVIDRATKLRDLSALRHMTLQEAQLVVKTREGEQARLRNSIVLSPDML